MTVRRYRHVAGPAIHPTSGGPVVLGDEIPLDETVAAAYVAAGQLIEQPEPPAAPAATEDADGGGEDPGPPKARRPKA